MTPCRDGFGFAFAATISCVGRFWGHRFIGKMGLTGILRKFPPMTDAERQQRHRDRRKNEGKVLVRVWVPAAAVAAVRAAIAAVLNKPQVPEEE